MDSFNTAYMPVMNHGITCLGVALIHLCCLAMIGQKSVRGVTLTLFRAFISTNKNTVWVFVMVLIVKTGPFVS